MDRYKIAIGHIKPTEPVVYKFKPSGAIKIVSSYMLKCFNDGIMFDSSNIRSDILDSAIIYFSKNMEMPIIVGSSKLAQTLSIAHGHKNIYSIDNNHAKSAIYYWDIPLSIIPRQNEILIIRRDSDG
jgi:hypothetical protein